MEKLYYESEGDTYAKAVFNLIQRATTNQPQFTLDDGSKIYRPFNFKENLVARIDDEKLFETCLDSCTGIAYKKCNTNRIKINPITKELITINKEFNESFLTLDYNSFEGEEITINKTSKKDKWLVAMGGINKENQEIYDSYKVKLIEFKEGQYYRKLNVEEKFILMGFYIIKNSLENNLKGMYIDYGYNYSSFSNGNLNNNTKFLLKK